MADGVDVGVRDREGPGISGFSNWVEDGTIHTRGKAASWVGRTGAASSAADALHVRIPSGDNIRHLEPGERSVLKDKLDGYQQVKGN